MKIANSPLAPVPVEHKAPENVPLRNVARQYEALFINQLIGAMRKTVNKGGLVPEGPGEKVYQSMLDSEYSTKMAESDQLGLSQMIYDHLLRSSGTR